MGGGVTVFSGMSGGHFDYREYAVNDIADEVQRLIEGNTAPGGRNYPEEVILEFRKAVSTLRNAFTYAHRIDYLVSSDDSEDTFLSQLKEELEK